jgi:hypothetical protein
MKSNKEVLEAIHIMKEKKYYKQKVLVVLMKGINNFVNLSGCNLLCNK